MKEIYLVYAEAEPTAAAKNASDLVGADAIMFISAESREEAQTLARSILFDYGYHLTEILSVSVPTPAAASQFHPQLTSQYHAAMIRGYGFQLAAQARDPNQLVENRSLGSPIFNDDEGKH